MSSIFNRTFVASTLCLTMIGGCATASKSNTARTGSEQILLSSAIDRSLSNVSFCQVTNQNVFVDEKYLDSVDKGYIISSIRHKVLAAGGRLVADAASADLVLEVRSGGVGTDMEQSFVGIPAIGIPGMPIELPEIKLLSKDKQKGTAKIGIVAYNPKSGGAYGLGGETTALTRNSNIYVLGIGPFRSGEVKEQMDTAIGGDASAGSIAGAVGYQTASGRRISPVGLVDSGFPDTQAVSPSNEPPMVPTLPVSHPKAN